MTIFHYPKYLRSSPHFVGLSLTDLLLLVGGLTVGLLINLSSIQTLVLLVTVIGCSKFIERRFTRNYFSFYFWKKDTLVWRDSYLNLYDRGILI